jgi:ABC-type oligopeptide transport system ATPase subunit
MSLLVVSQLVKVFRKRAGASGSTEFRAVDEVSFAVERGEAFGIVGESGSGKTTTARCVLRLTEPSSGSVTFDGTDILELPPGPLRRMRRHFQMVFQDANASLNPRMRAGAIVEEPLIIHRTGTASERRHRVAELFGMVGLDPSHTERLPHEFSGGQRQRIGIARALALSPSLLIADEPVSSLDLSVQAQIVNLLLELQQRLGLTYVLITHDLRLAHHVCTRLAVMYRGRIVEIGPAADICSTPQHPYTRALLSAMSVAVPGARADRVPFDDTVFDPRVPLREVAPGHDAAV